MPEPVMIVDLQQRRQDEINILKKLRFQEFIAITENIILPVFYRDGKNEKIVVTPPEYEMQVVRFLDAQNKPGGPASDINCHIQYGYLVKHWR